MILVNFKEYFHSKYFINYFFKKIIIMYKLLVIIFVSTNNFCINLEALGEVRGLFIDKLEEMKKISNMKK